jgi:hypothetical protein
VAWGVKPIKVAADYATDAMMGHEKNVGSAFSSVMGAVVEGYNPAGGTDLMSAITPSLMDIPVDIARNKAWTGSKIRPNWDKYAPASTQYFKNLPDTPEGRLFIGITQKLSEASGHRIEISPEYIDYAFQQLIGGVGRFLTKSGSTAAALATGQKPDVKDVPFASRFLRQIPLDRQGTSATQMDDLTKIRTEQSRDRFYQTQKAEQLYQEMKKLPQGQASQAFTELKAKDKNMAADIVSIAKDEKLGLTSTDRQIKQLGVANGQRALYLYDQFKALPDNKARGELWEDLSKKKLITSDVAAQLKSLIQQRGLK